LDPKPKTRRKSAPTAREESGEVSQAKKRGRPSAKANKEPVDSEGDDAPVNKKPRKSNGSKAATKAQQDDREETPPVGDMERFMRIPSWESMIESVDTVERDGEELMVYFTLCVVCCSVLFSEVVISVLIQQERQGTCRDDFDDLPRKIPKEG
jgi:hypothetical protein